MDLSHLGESREAEKVMTRTMRRGWAEGLRLRSESNNIVPYLSVLFHEIRKNPMLALEFPFRGADPPILVATRSAGAWLEDGGDVLKELLPPMIGHRGVSAGPVTGIGGGVCSRR